MDCCGVWRPLPSAVDVIAKNTFLLDLLSELHFTLYNCNSLFPFLFDLVYIFTTPRVIFDKCTVAGSICLSTSSIHISPVSSPHYNLRTSESQGLLKRPSAKIALLFESVGIAFSTTDPARFRNTCFTRFRASRVLSTAPAAFRPYARGSRAAPTLYFPPKPKPCPCSQNVRESSVMAFYDCPRSTTTATAQRRKRTC